MKTFSGLISEMMDSEIGSFQKAVNSTQIGYDEMPDEVRAELDELLDLQDFYIGGDYTPSVRTVRDFKRITKRVLKIQQKYGQKVVGRDMIRGTEGSSESDAWSKD